MIELNCPACGNNRFRYPDAAGDAPILCETCGHSLGTFDQLKERMAEEVLSRRKR